MSHRQPWLRRSRSPLPAFDGGHFRMWMLFVMGLVGLIGGGISGLIYHQDLRGSLALLIAGLAALALFIAYVLRPVRRQAPIRASHRRRRN